MGYIQYIYNYIYTYIMYTVFVYEILMNDVTTDGDMMNVKYTKYE